MPDPGSKPGFRITGGKGFHITFANGWTVSVQFGIASYSEHHNAPIGPDFAEESKRLAGEGSATAEIGAWNAAGKWYALGDYDDVVGYRKPAEVLAILNMIAGLAPDAEPKRKRKWSEADEADEADVADEVPPKSAEEALCRKEGISEAQLNAKLGLALPEPPVEERQLIEALRSATLATPTKRLVRDRECHTCKHTWTSSVKMAAFSPNVSGEATEHCPECDSRDVDSSPWREVPLGWVQFWDMHSGGGLKQPPYHYICIEAASQEEAEVIFQNRFGRNPRRVTCTCCGPDYSIEELEPTLEEATSYHRGCRIADPFVEGPAPAGEPCSRGRKYVTLDEFRKREDVLVVFAGQVKPEERVGSLHEEGYVWR